MTNSIDATNSNDQNDVRDAMRSYWQQYSVQGTVEEMMLDDAASFIDQHERPEILSMLPDFHSKRVLELGAGIGRFTGALADSASHVVAVDFMQTNVDVNKRQNAHRTNVDVLCEDVTKLQLEAHSFDLIFSNW
jgi:phosphoethanolamine N-methyltransferase